jgi:hypothetical protein
MDFPGYDGTSENQIRWKPITIAFELSRVVPSGQFNGTEEVAILDVGQDPVCPCQEGAD